MIDWTRGYSARWAAYAVNVPTWADGEALSGVVSASVERDVSSEAALVESGTIELDAPVGEGFGERYVRLAMVAEQGGETERVDVCTLLCSCSSGDVDKGVDRLSLDGRSVLWPASRKVLPRGEYVPRGYDCVAWCREMLEGCLAAPVVAEGSFTLTEHYVIDLGSSVLDAVWLVLDAGGWCLQIDGDGTVHVRPRPTEPALVLDDVGARLIVPGVHHELDWSEVPNRYWATDGSNAAVAVNRDPASPTSTVSRGYESDAYDSSPMLVDGEDLQGYAERMLEERSTVHDVRSYVREWWPGVTCYSVVRGTLPSIALDGDLVVERQSLECGHGIKVSEQAYREVRSWQR